ncbi:golgin subfamily A member 6-like protein 22 [Ruditapes philippinarum]|uniref:golgin subfamily A member 6-like protein 22 n=1 Tax=Ruditapes philippinarum TaxID=129788 RepID=UPI00295AFB34|nr:golgin subfamily A member 6-like protein 22 [Ruditapes philippinarum]
MEGAMSERESRKLRRDAIRDQLQTRNEQEIRMPSNNYRANTNQHEAEDSDRDRQGSYTRILQSNGTINQAYRRADDSSEQNSNMVSRTPDYENREILQDRANVSTRRENTSLNGNLVGRRKSVSFDIDRQGINADQPESSDEFQTRDIDYSSIDLSQEMMVLDEKLEVLRQQNADLLSQNNSGNLEATSDYSKKGSSRNTGTHSPSVEEYKDSDKHRMQSSTRNENTNVKIVPEKTGISNRFIYMDEISDIDKDDFGQIGGADKREYRYNKPKDNFVSEPYFEADTHINDGRFSTYYRRRNYEDVIPDSTDMHEHVHGYTGNYGDIKLEDYRGIRNDTVKPKIERRCTDATYNIVPEEYREYHPRGQQWMEEERVRFETEREQKLLQKLYEQNRQIEYEREIKEQEERQLVERIRRLQIAKDELSQKRTERERLEKEIQKKMELESLRTQRIVILKRQEERLSDQVGENIRRKESIHDDTEKESTQFTKVEQNSNRSGFGKPKIPQFDGNDFKVWKIEVECIIKSGIYPEYLIAQTIRNSLKGHTRKVLLTIDPMASSAVILKKLEDIYGTTQTEDSIMQDFFNAKQDEKETTSDWALRLETIMQLAVETGEIPERKKNALLKQRFWKGLKSEKLRNNTRVTYESDATFEVLRKKARVEEDEIKRTSSDTRSVKPVNTQTTEVNVSKETQACQRGEIQMQQQSMKTTSFYMDKQMNMMQSLMDKMNRLEQEISNIKKGGIENSNKGYTRDARYFENPNRGNYFRGRRQYSGDFYGPPGRPYYMEYYDRQDHRQKIPPKSQKESNQDRKDDRKKPEGKPAEKDQKEKPVKDDLNS